MLYIVCAVLTVLIAAALITAYATYRIGFFSPKRGQGDPKFIPLDDQYQVRKDLMLSLVEELEAKDFEPVSIKSFDGLTLFGRYYHVKDGAALDIDFHGYRGSAQRDFSGGSKISFENGHNVLLVDERAHGKSEGHVITFGIKERFDCRDWVKYAVERFGKDTKIFLSGVSMGAATVLMASSTGLEKNVAGIIADCGYSSPKEIICTVCERDMHLPSKLMYPFVRLGAFLFGHFDLEQSSAVEAIKSSSIPTLIIHGEDDRFVPFEMGGKIYDACASPKAFLPVPGAGHGLSYLVETEKYTEAVKKFMAECLSETSEK